MIARAPEQHHEHRPSFPRRNTHFPGAHYQKPACRRSACSQPACRRMGCFGERALTPLIIVSICYYRGALLKSLTQGIQKVARSHVNVASCSSMKSQAPGNLEVGTIKMKFRSNRAHSFLQVFLKHNTSTSVLHHGLSP